MDVYVPLCNAKKYIIMGKKELLDETKSFSDGNLLSINALSMLLEKTLNGYWQQDNFLLRLTRHPVTSEIFLITFLDIKEKNRERTLNIYDSKLHVNRMNINHGGI